MPENTTSPKSLSQLNGTTITGPARLTSCSAAMISASSVDFVVELDPDLLGWILSGPRRRLETDELYASRTLRALTQEKREALSSFFIAEYVGSLHTVDRLGGLTVTFPIDTSNWDRETKSYLDAVLEVEATTSILQLDADYEDGTLSELVAKAIGYVWSDDANEFGAYVLKSNDVDEG